MPRSTISCCCRRISSARRLPTRRNTGCGRATTPIRPIPGSITGRTGSARSSPARISLLEPNPYWAGPPGHFRRITVRAIENTAALEANLLSGTIDMVAGELGLSLDEALAFEKRHGDAFQMIYKPGLVFEHVDLNLDRPALADRRVREALLLGLDREAISEVAVRRPPEGRRQLRQPARCRLQRRGAALPLRSGPRRDPSRCGRLACAAGRRSAATPPGKPCRSN